MKRCLSIQLKGILLLVVFSLNTLVGFACSVGLDMGFNSKHHKEEKDVVAHSHAHANPKAHHGHEEKAHDENANDHHSSSEDKDNCCKDQMTKLAKADKLMPHPVDFNIHPVFFTAFLSTFFHVDFSPIHSHTPDNKLFVRCHHPPISNIRVAIQSFQI